MSKRVVGGLLKTDGAPAKSTLTAEQVIEGEKFREWLICTHVEEPRIVPRGAEPGEPDAVSFPDLMETNPSSS
jgi:hypothetical protein